MRSQHTGATDASIAFSGAPIEDRTQAENRRAKQDTFLAMLGTSGWSKAARAAGCDISDVSRWKKLDSDFALRLSAENEAIADGLERIADEIAKGDRDATPAQTAMIQFRLRALRPSVYRERQSVEISGPNGSAIRVEGDKSRAKMLMAEWST